jgi:hypothetical protein
MNKIYKMMLKLKQSICSHRWEEIWVYGWTADYQCTRCKKHGKGWYGDKKPLKKLNKLLAVK